MKRFDLIKEYNKTISDSNIVKLLFKIHEYKGKQPFLIDTKKRTLDTLLNVAKIQSTSASNKIEGINVADKRINGLINQKLEPKNRNEEEVAGYRDALSIIHENYEYIEINKETILKLHEILYKYTGYEFGGQFKKTQNCVTQLNEKGEKIIRFKPLSPEETPDAIEDLCDSYNDLVSSEYCDQLLLIPIFIFEFLSIHPFDDGNGRLSRLLTLLLLYKADYLVGKYISIEKIIEDTKDSYYDALKKSSNNWHNSENDYTYFVSYYLGILLNAYREFDSRISITVNKRVKSYDRIKSLFKETIIPINKSFIINRCPDLSETTIERVLNKLLREKKITKISGGRYTKYVWNNDKNTDEINEIKKIPEEESKKTL